MNISTDIFCSEIFHAANLPYLNMINIRRRKIIFSQYKYIDQNMSKSFIDENIRSKWHEYTSDVTEADADTVSEHQNYLESMLSDLRQYKNVKNFQKHIRSPNVMVDLSSLLSLDDLPTIKRTAFDIYFLADIIKYQNGYQFLISCRENMCEKLVK